MEHTSASDDAWVVVNPLASTDSQALGPANAPAPTQATTAPTKKKSTKNISCRFWGTSAGCRSGDQCRFYHDPALAETAASSASAQQDGETASAQSVRRYNVPQVAPSRVVSKPVPNKQKADPREFELQQVRRRFSPKDTTVGDGTELAIEMPPSDPDFPFELSYLDCILHVPTTYPASGKPYLQVKNSEMERIHQAAIERGFSSIVALAPKATLLNYLNTLDKELEGLLSGEREEVIFKIVANRGKPQSPTVPETERNEGAEALVSSHMQMAPLFSNEELSEAAAKRATETRQLEARLGRLPLYARIDQYTYTLPLEPRLRAKLPSSLQNVKSVHLHVPETYPLEPCTITIPGVLDEAAVLAEIAFEDRAEKHKEQTLMAHVNYLTQHLHDFATQIEPLQASVEDVAAEPSEDGEASRPSLFEEEKRSHIRFIARPPEWDEGFGSESNDDGSATESEEEEPSEEDDNASPAGVHTVDSAPDRGVAIDLVDLNFPPAHKRGSQGIALAEITHLRLTVQCGRCKTIVEMPPLTTRSATNPSKPDTAGRHGSVTCARCTSELAIEFRPSLMFPGGPGQTGGSRAGTLECTGCRPADLLPSTFLVTCADCDGTSTSTSHVLDNVNRCEIYDETCHLFQRIEWPRVHFLLLSHAKMNALPRRKQRALDAAGFPKVGAALPKNGACDHYARSFRWFRFGCCAKVHPCDRCHDAAEDHPCERATRMVCGFCAREQAFRATDCGRCGALLVKKTGKGGFWEGGKGTRDRARMSRKDPRKFKRPGATSAVKGKKVAGNESKKKKT